MSTVAEPTTTIEEELGQQVDDLLDEHWAVVIMDSDNTTFAQVERACVDLFGYSGSEAAALAMRVHTTGEAVAAVMGETAARRAVRQLRGRNVLARIERV